jgi:hypothetical protein
MIAVAALPLAAGLSGAAFENPVKLAAGFPVAMTIAAAALLRPRCSPGRRSVTTR